jgi:hypothetical protein
MNKTLLLLSATLLVGGATPVSAQAWLKSLSEKAVERAVTNVQNRVGEKKQSSSSTTDTQQEQSEAPENYGASLFGSAEYARIVSDTATVNSEIETYNEQISQIRKSQSSMNDFATINEICRNRGMTMNWYRGDSASGAPVSSPVSGSAAPQATPAATPETNGD